MDISNNENYIKLAKFLFKPILVLFGFVFIFSLLQVVTLYFIYIPEYIDYFQAHLNSTDIGLLHDAMSKIVINIGVWVVVLLIINVFLIKILHNAKKLIKDIENDC